MATRALAPRSSILGGTLRSCTAISTTQQRRVHSSRPKNAIAASPPQTPLAIPSQGTSPNTNHGSLSILPTSSVLRSYMITRMSSSPTLLRACFTLLRQMLDSKSVLTNPEKNAMLRWMFKNTFYAQFCAGENRGEVQRTAEGLKKMGYSGVILEYALEVLEGEVPSAAETEAEIEVFRKGMREAIAMAGPGDFVALKWSGLGRKALHLLQEDRPPTKAMQDCITEICDAAKAKGARFLPGAEEESTGVNNGIDSWTINLMRRYNKDEAFMYNTYQCYLLSTPKRIAKLLAMAGQEGFIPGIKPVRGAYLLSEPKSAVTGSFEETSQQYDGIVEALLRRQWNTYLQSPSSSLNTSFPEVGMVLATHNADSIRKVQAIRNEQVRKGEGRIELAYAQLQGMADELSCELLAASKVEHADAIDRPRPFKAATWGSVMECMNFLLRRALENQDAMGRTVETRKAMGRELRRRMLHTVGLH